MAVANRNNEYKSVQLSNHENSLKKNKIWIVQTVQITKDFSFLVLAPLTFAPEPPRRGRRASVGSTVSRKKSSTLKNKYTPLKEIEIKIYI